MRKTPLRSLARFGGAAALVALVAACGPDGTDATEPSTLSSGLGAGKAPDGPRVVATTTLVGDVVSEVGGQDIALTVLMPPGADPHGFEPTPSDVAAVADADLVFMNGLGLEEMLEPLLENAGGQARIVTVSEGVETIELGEGDGHDGADHRDGDDAAHSRGTDGRHHVDPHVWFDPTNTLLWTDNVVAALSELDPGRSEAYQDRGREYQAELDELDRWIEEQVAVVPTERRRLVTDHQVLGYFARRYGFEQVGSLHGFSTLSEASASDLASLLDAIQELDVRAVFVGTTVNPSLAERVAEDTGTRVVAIYTGSLSEPEGPAATYLEFMRYNVSAIVEGLE